MSDFLNSKANLGENANLAAIQQLAQAYLETTNLTAVVWAAQRLREIEKIAIEKNLVSGLEIWNTEPHRIEGAWRFVLHNEDTALQIETLQHGIEKEFPAIQFSFRWLKK
jgi:hypothetical protein